MHDCIEKVLIKEEDIIVRCQQLAKQITNDYKNLPGTPIVVTLLMGGIPFLSELIKHIDIDIHMDYMDVSSYQGTKSTRDVKIIKDLDGSIDGLDIILLEDIIDTGYTLKKVIDLLYNKGANSVKVVSLLDKPSKRLIDIKADYIGFTIEDAFVVGFGLDFNQLYRNLPYIGILKKEYYMED